MSNDIGMIKAFPALAQTNPAAPTGSVERKAKAEPEATRQAETADKEEQPNRLEDVVSDLNELVRDLHRELKFSVDEDSGATVIRVIDKATDEVVRQIPSEELMHLRKRLQEAAGVIFHDSA